MRGFRALVLTLYVVMPAGTPAFAVDAHSTLTWQGPTTCLACHLDKAEELFTSVHYRWKGPSPEIVNHPRNDGKFKAMNAYCINPLGNWEGCKGCHVGLGAPPSKTLSDEQLANIDCLICHQPLYKRVKDVSGIFQPDTATMIITMDQAVQTVARPTRVACLQCHARAGGGDALKRGDLTLAHGTTADRDFDVHMATSGADLSCTACHKTRDHEIAGRGSDLRPSDRDKIVSCSTKNCHATKRDNVMGHSDVRTSRHVDRVACQSCHIPRYARNAADTVASERTELHRTWAVPEFDTGNNRWEPTKTLANDVLPVYRFWTRMSWGYDLYDDVMVDNKTGYYKISNPKGRVVSPAGKLYPFKFKTAEQPLVTGRNQLVALDTRVFFATGVTDDAVRSGLVNMGYGPDEPYVMVTTQEYQLLNHQVAPAAQALACAACHVSGSATQMNLATLGYTLKADRSVVCRQCHGSEDERPNFYQLHNKHVLDLRIDCSMCHKFSRPERNLRVGIVTDD